MALRPILIALGVSSLWLANSLVAEDWPRWRGPRADGTLAEGMSPPEVFPDEGLPVVWRQKIGGGFSGVTTSKARVYTMDRDKAKGLERVLCFSATDGTLLWQDSYPADYKGMDYDSGPRASVTIHDGLAYSLGARGHVRCLDAETGKLIWSHDTVAELGAKLPTWGLAASPVIHEEKVIYHVGAQNAGCFLAFDRKSGKEIWRNLEDPAGYCTPVLLRHNDLEQMIAWTPEHLQGLRPANGQKLWSIPWKVTYGVSIATPIFHEGILLVNEYWKGSKAFRLEGDQAKLLWEKEDLCGLMSQALYREGFVYMLDKAKGLSCYELKTGQIRWQDDKHKLTPADRHPHLSMVQIQGGDRAYILNSNGELISVKLNPEGWKELSRVQLIDKTWADPAYSDDSVYARSDRQIIRARFVPGN